MEAFMHITNISEAKATLSKLIEQVINGDEVIIGKAGKPVAKLIPYTVDTNPRTLGAGQWQGQIWLADDFDDLPDEVLNLFTGEATDNRSSSNRKVDSGHQRPPHQTICCTDY
jgi:prevent-host-death family protein